MASVTEEEKLQILGICGSPKPGGNTETYLQYALDAVAGDDIAAETINVARAEISDCKHCNFCLSKQSAAKICNIDDDMTWIFPKLMAADIIFFASPVYSTRISGYMAKFTDRLRSLIHGKYYHHALSGKVGAALAVGWYRHSGIETTLLTLVTNMLILEMLPVGCLGGYGAGAVSSDHGEGGFDVNHRLGVLKDNYGLASARQVAIRAVATARLLKLGHAAQKG